MLVFDQGSVLPHIYIIFLQLGAKPDFSIVFSSIVNSYNENKAEFQVRLVGTKTTYILIILDSSQYICDIPMIKN